MTMPDAPTKKNAFIEPKVGWSSIDGAWAKIDVGYKPLPNLSVYTYGLWTPRETSAGAGLKYEFDIFK